MQLENGGERMGLGMGMTHGPSEQFGPPDEQLSQIFSSLYGVPPFGYPPSVPPMGYPDYHMNAWAVQQAVASLGHNFEMDHMGYASQYMKGKGKGNRPRDREWGKGKKGGGGKDERKGRKGFRRNAAQPAENLNDALNEPVPEGCSEQLQELRRRGERSGLTLRDLGDATIEFATDQFGSLFLLQAVEVATEEDRNLVFMKVLPQAHRLCIDPFGNVVLQKLLEHSSAELNRVFAQQLIGHVWRLSIDIYGCRVVQKVLEEVSTDQQILLVNELQGHVCECIEDQHGNHVVQKCIERLPPENISFIVDELRASLDKMATHCYGCRVVQRILEHGSPQQTAPILDDLLPKVLQLFPETYGNYVVQHILEHGRPEDRRQIISLVTQKPFDLSSGQFSSNVVEKSLVIGDDVERNTIIASIIDDRQDPLRLQRMVNHRYANYVVQRLLDIADQQQKEKCFWILMDQVTLAQLKKSNFGKHILSKLKQIASTIGPSAVAHFSTVAN